MRRTRDLLILALGWSDNQTNETLSEILGVGERAVCNLLKELQREKLVQKIPYSNNCVLTEIGNERFRELKEEISEYELTPEKNGTTRVCKLKNIIGQVRQPETLVRLIKALWKNEPYDVIGPFQNEEGLKEGSFLGLWMEEMVLNGEGRPIKEDNAFRDLSLLGIKSRIYKQDISDVKSFLIMADLKRRKGKVKEAMWDFQNIVYGEGIEQGYWTVGLIGLIYCINIIKGSETALSMIDKELKQYTTPGHKAWLIYIKADLLSDLGEYKKADKFFRSSLRILETYKMEISMTEVLNSYGVNLFRQGDIGGAERQWIRCRNYCNKHKLPRMRSIAEINLADIYSKRGNTRRAHDNLNRATRVLLEVGDFEGISGVNFNRALVHLRAGKYEKAVYALRQSEEYPLIYKQKRDERRRVFEQCCIETGHPFSRNPL